jgi:hypothetical protein
VRLEGKGPARAVSAPADARLVGDRWAIANGAAIDVVANKRAAIPAIATATEAPDGSLVAVTAGPHPELVTVASGTAKVARVPITIDAATAGASDANADPKTSHARSAPIVAMGIVADGHDRIAIALRDGRIVVRDRGTWSTRIVHDDPPPAHPGSPPANAP